MFRLNKKGLTLVEIMIIVSIIIIISAIAIPNYFAAKKRHEALQETNSRTVDVSDKSNHESVKTEEVNTPDISGNFDHIEYLKGGSSSATIIYFTDGRTKVIQCELVEVAFPIAKGDLIDVYEGNGITRETRIVKK